MAIVFKGYQGALRSGTTSNWTVINSGQNTVTSPDGFGTAIVSTGDLAVVLVGVGSTLDRTLSATTSDWTKFGTELYSNGSSADANAAIFYRVATTNSLPALTISGGTGSTADAGYGLLLLFSGVDGTTPLDVAIQTATGTATTRPNPPSITPTTEGALVFGAGVGATATGAIFTDPGSYVAETGYFQSFNSPDTVDCTIFMGIQEANWTSGAVDPAQVSGGTNNAGDSWAAFTIALRPSSGTTLNAPEFNNDDGVIGSIFYGPTLFYDQFVVPGLATNSSTFYGPTAVAGTVGMTPASMFRNGQTFYSAAVYREHLMTASLTTNSQTFYTINVGIDQELTAPFLDAGNTVYEPSAAATYLLTVPRLNNSNTFYDVDTAVGAVTLTQSYVINNKAGDSGLGSQFFNHYLERVPFNPWKATTRFKRGKPYI